jgi:quercetin dioxygenase-like cupin family protein
MGVFTWWNACNSRIDNFSIYKNTMMAVQKYAETQAGLVRDGVERRLGHTEHLMMAIFDFNDGPQSEPDPPHSHPHEQVSYVAEGEIYFFLEDQREQLGPGDMFLVPPGRPHAIQLLSKHARLVDCFYPLRQDFLEQHSK